MEKEFLSYSQSLSLKELGFDEKCFGYYNYDGSHFFKYKPKTDIKNLTKAPLYQQAFRWFREKHDLHHTITKHITEYSFDTNVGGFKLFGTYEEAESACIDKFIEIVKEGK